MKILFQRIFSYKNNMQGSRAQAIVEFAIALPILLLMLMGIFEVGRMVFIYAAVTNASRNAARYASAFGLGDDGLHKFSNCQGIKAVAIVSSFLVPLDPSAVSITYDHGPGTSFSPALTCDAASGEDRDVFYTVSSGDRVVVTVTADYEPMIKLVPIGGRSITSSTARTILGYVDVYP